MSFSQLLRPCYLYWVDWKIKAERDKAGKQWRQHTVTVKRPCPALHSALILLIQSRHALFWQLSRLKEAREQRASALCCCGSATVAKPCCMTLRSIIKEKLWGRVWGKALFTTTPPKKKPPFGTFIYWATREQKGLLHKHLLENFTVSSWRVTVQISILKAPRNPGVIKTTRYHLCFNAMQNLSVHNTIHWQHVGKALLEANIHFLWLWLTQCTSKSQVLQGLMLRYNLYF